MTDKRTAFFVSDRTGITAEMLGHSLLTQFESVHFEEVTLPFVDSVEKARDVVRQINQLAEKERSRPIVISTLVNTDIAEVVRAANALFLDCFEIFISPLEKELGVRASHAVGRSHSVNDFVNYHHRIESVNYTLSHDDGVSTRDLTQADVILVGVSRCGKTPTCLYLAMQYGVRAANYPLVPEDFSTSQLPTHLRPLRPRLYGLTIRPERLQQIRNERRPGSKYAEIKQCRWELDQADKLFRRDAIPVQNTTHTSIEEIASKILSELGIEKHMF